MGLFKPDFYRFFAAGFALGAILVFANMDDVPGSALTGSVVPVAEAAPAP